MGFVSCEGAPRIAATTARNKAFTTVQTGMPTKDWKAYLDQNPDVKAFLESQHASMELGAQNHYETKGRFEHRPLPKSRSPLPPAGQGFFYIYRSLRLEGFSTP